MEKACYSRQFLIVKVHVAVIMVNSWFSEETI